MIYINNKYKDFSYLPEKVAFTLSWLFSFDCRKLGEEKYFFTKDNFAFRKVAETGSRTKGLFEAHKKYIDLHYLLKGEEIFEIGSTSRLKIYRKYQADTDTALYHPPASPQTFIKASARDIIILFPEDAHMPLVSTGSPIVVEKVIVKILI